MNTKSPLSNSLQDYLEAILVLAEKKDHVRITDLAKYLQIAKPSVSGMVKNLVALGLLKHEKYGPMQMTELGMKKAIEVRHRHQVIKNFLVCILGVNPEVADQEACLMEHTISEDTTEKLVALLEKQNCLED